MLLKSLGVKRILSEIEYRGALLSRNRPPHHGSTMKPAPPVTKIRGGPSSNSAISGVVRLLMIHWALWVVCMWVIS